MARIWASALGGGSNDEVSSPKPRKSSIITNSHGRNRPRLSSRDKSELNLLQQQPQQQQHNGNANGHNPSTATPTHSPRRRINSRDIPRSYSGMYGFADDLLPFEVQRNRSISTQSFPLVFMTYLTLLVILHSLSVCLFHPY